jgi:protein-tyrosine phosphatase
MSSMPRTEYPALPPLQPKALLMVCLGNICRSPTAEVVLRHRLEVSGLAVDLRVDSAGTHAGGVGMPPDPRSIAHAARRGYDLRGLKARRLHGDDYDTFGLILAMDGDNLAHMRAACPASRRDRLVCLMDFAPAGLPRAVPDPYYAGAAAFEQALDLIEAACDGLAEYLHTRRGV